MKIALLRIVSSILLIFILAGSLFSCKSNENPAPESESIVQSDKESEIEVTDNQEEIVEVDTSVKRDGKFTVFNGKE